MLHRRQLDLFQFLEELSSKRLLPSKRDLQGRWNENRLDCSLKKNRINLLKVTKKHVNIQVTKMSSCSSNKDRGDSTEQQSQHTGETEAEGMVKKTMDLNTKTAVHLLFETESQWFFLFFF